MVGRLPEQADAQRTLGVCRQPGDCLFWEGTPEPPEANQSRRTARKLCRDTGETPLGEWDLPTMERRKTSCSPAARKALFPVSVG